jgi:hypothetical protein
MESSGIKCKGTGRDRKFVSLTRLGKFHGLALWFDCLFKPNFYDEEVEKDFK